MLIQPNMQDIPAPAFDGMTVRDEVDNYILAVLNQQIGVVSGCQVTQDTGFDMKVQVASGSVIANNNIIYPIVATTLTIAAASSTDRRDTVCYTPGTGLQVIQGAPSPAANWNRFSPLAAPVKAIGSGANQVPFGSVVLAEVYVSASTTFITSGWQTGNIVDKTAILFPTPVPPLGAATLLAHSWGTNVAAAIGTHDNVVERLCGRLGIQYLQNLAIGGTQMAAPASVFGAFGGFAGMLHTVVPSVSHLVAESNYFPGGETGTGGAPLLVLHGVNDLVSGAPIATGSAQTAVQWLLMLNNAYNLALTTSISRHLATIVYSYYTLPAAGATAASPGAVIWPDGSLSFAQGTGASNGWAIQNNVGVAYPANTGPGSATSAVNGNTFTIQLPNNFTGGPICIVILGNATGLATLNSSPGITAGQSTGTTFTSIAISGLNQCFPTGAQVVQVDSEQILCSGVAFNSGTGVFTFTIQTRNINGAGQVAHTTAGSFIFTPRTGYVSFNSGTVGTASVCGSMPNTYFTGQAEPSVNTAGLFFQNNNQYISIPIRVTALASDAGKTIIGTINNIQAGDASSQLIFDSWWQETLNPSPTVVANVPRMVLGTGPASNTAFTLVTAAQIASLNAQMVTTLSQFGSWCQLVDIDSIWNVRNAVLNGAVAAATASATAASTQSASGTTITVNSTAGYSAPGVITFYDSLNQYNVVSYTSVTGGSNTVFGGCVGGRQGTNINSGTPVVAATSVSLTLNSAANPPIVGQRWAIGNSIAPNTSEEDMLLLSQTSLVGTAFTGVFGRSYNAASGTANNVAHSNGDLCSPTDWMFTDNVHPSPYGSTIIADAFYQAFQAACYNCPSLSLTMGAASTIANNRTPSGSRVVDQGWWIPPMADGTTTVGGGFMTISASGAGTLNNTPSNIVTTSNPTASGFIAGSTAQPGFAAIVTASSGNKVFKYTGTTATGFTGCVSVDGASYAYNNSAGVAGSGAMLIAYPFDIEGPGLIEVIAAATMATASGAGSSTRLGLYFPDVSGAHPASLVIDFGAISTVAAAWTYGTGLSQQINSISKLLYPGRYFIGIIPNISANTTPATFRTIGSNTTGAASPLLPPLTTVATTLPVNQAYGGPPIARVTGYGGAGAQISTMPLTFPSANFCSDIFGGAAGTIPVPAVMLQFRMHPWN